LLSVLILRGGWRRPYLRFRRILIKMADGFFSSSWRILEPYSCATHPRGEDGRSALGRQRAREPRKNKTSRWNAGKDLSFVPLRPERVVEVRYDHMEGERFRHTAQFNRWRRDRDPRSSTHAQLEHPLTFSLGDIVPGLGPADA